MIIGVAREGEKESIFTRSEYGFGLRHDGYLHNSGQYKKYCEEKFSKGDIITCMLNMEEGILQYKLNGKPIGKPQ